MINLSVVKKADRNYVFCGFSAIITYSIMITNTGTSAAKSVQVTDVLGQGQCFVRDTVMLNGQKQNLTGLDTGVNIGVVPAGGNVILSFQVQVKMDDMLNQVENQAIVSYCDEQGNTREIRSNKILVPVIKMDVCTNKTADKQEVQIGEVITYAITINNQGNQALNNIRLYDILPTGLKFLPGTVMVNFMGKDVPDLNGGIILDTLPAPSNAVITFQAQVISYPAGGLLENRAYIQYEYTVIIDGVAYTSIGESCSCPYNTTVINQTITC